MAIPGAPMMPGVDQVDYEESDEDGSSDPSGSKFDKSDSFKDQYDKEIQSVRSKARASVAAASSRGRSNQY